MLTDTQARRLRSIGRYASHAKSEIELANALGISPMMASQTLQAIRDLVALVPPVKTGRKRKNEQRKQTAAV